MSLQLLNLNDDVLYHITDKLHGANALRFSLASKRAHGLAIHRVPAIFWFRHNDVYHLPLHRHYLLDGLEPRARHIQELVCHHRDIDPHMERQVPDSEGLAPFLVDLIYNAPNLRRLALTRTSWFIVHHPRLKDSLLRLHKLSRVELESVGLPVLDFLSSTPWNLSVLSLSHYLSDLEVPRQSTAIASHFWTLLLKALATLPHLRTLRIHYCSTKSSIEDVYSGVPPPSLPAIRELFISTTSPAVLCLACLMPNLQTLFFETKMALLDHHGHRIIRVPSSRPGPTLPTLHSLILMSSECLRCAEAHLGTAHHFRIIRMLRCHEPDSDAEHAEEVRALIAAFRRVSPVCAEVFLAVGGRPMGFWKQIAVDAQRLRYMELRVRLAEVDAANAGWLDNIPEALASLPLVGLRLHLREMPGVTVRSIEGADHLGWYPLESPVYAPQKVVAKQLYAARIETVKGLPRRLANAIRTLRVIAIADGHWDTDYEGGRFKLFPHGRWHWNRDGICIDSASPARGDSWDDIYAHQNHWYMEVVATLEWWRVIRDGDEIVRLDALTAEAGKRVQRFFEDSDLETLDCTIDDFISKL